MSRRSTSIPVLCVFVACMSCILVAALPQAALAQAEPPAYVPGEVLIGWRADSGIVLASRAPAGRLDEDRTSPEWQRAVRTLAALTGMQVLDAQPEYGTARLAVEPGQEQAEIGRLKKLSWVRYAEPNYLVWAATVPQGDTTYPSDPYFGNQWNMRRIGAPEAWAVTFGSYSMVVAVVDSGVDLAHPEFTGQFHDPLLPGYDYVNRDNTPDDDTANSHGTHVTGILAAAANNGIGVAGLAPKVKILPLKVLKSDGSGTHDNISMAIRRAADANAQIINLSLGGSDSSATLLDAVNYALARNALVVAAAGNCAQGGSGCTAFNPTFYPAAYPGVLAVAASDRFDNWAFYSGYKSYVGLAAPGGISVDAVWSTVRNGYGPLSGTSMAVPLVSGAAVLVWTLAPASTPQQVAGILKDTADKVGTNPQTGQSIPYVNGRNDYFGAGRLNVGKAVRRAYPPALTPVTGLQQFLLGGSVTQGERQVLLSNPSSQEITWQATVIEGAAWLGINPAIGNAKYTGPGTLALRANRGALTPGVYDGRVRVQPLDVTGIPSFEIPVQLRVNDTMRRTFLPGIARDWLGGWLDPLAPGGPAAQGLYLNDNTASQVNLPFPVAFYGGTYRTMWVSDNGMVVFGGTSPGAPPAGCPPSAAAPNNAIYVLGLDWRPDLGGQVYVHQPDADTYTVTWYEIERAGNTLPQSFQLVLHRDGPLIAHYRTIEPAAPGIIGAENWDGTVAQQIWCSGVGSAPGSDGAVVFTPVLPW